MSKCMNVTNRQNIAVYSIHPPVSIEKRSFDSTKMWVEYNTIHGVSMLWLLLVKQSTRNVVLFPDS